MANSKEELLIKPLKTYNPIKSISRSILNKQIDAGFTDIILTTTSNTQPNALQPTKNMSLESLNKYIENTILYTMGEGNIEQYSLLSSNAFAAIIANNLVIGDASLEVIAEIQKNSKKIAIKLFRNKIKEEKDDNKLAENTGDLTDEERESLSVPHLELYQAFMQKAENVEKVFKNNLNSAHSSRMFFEKYLEIKKQSLARNFLIQELKTKIESKLENDADKILKLKQKKLLLERENLLEGIKLKNLKKVIPTHYFDKKASKVDLAREEEEVLNIIREENHSSTIEQMPPSGIIEYLSDKFTRKEFIAETKKFFNIKNDNGIFNENLKINETLINTELTHKIVELSKAEVNEKLFYLDDFMNKLKLKDLSTFDNDLTVEDLKNQGFPMEYLNLKTNILFNTEPVIIKEKDGDFFHAFYITKARIESKETFVVAKISSTNPEELATTIRARGREINSSIDNCNGAVEIKNFYGRKEKKSVIITIQQKEKPIKELENFNSITVGLLNDFGIKFENNPNGIIEIGLTKKVNGKQEKIENSDGLNSSSINSLKEAFENMNKIVINGTAVFAKDLKSSLEEAEKEAGKIRKNSKNIKSMVIKETLILELFNDSLNKKFNTVFNVKEESRAVGQEAGQEAGQEVGQKKKTSNNPYICIG